MIILVSLLECMVPKSLVHGYQWGGLCEQSSDLVKTLLGGSEIACELVNSAFELCNIPHRKLRLQKLAAETRQQFTATARVVQVASLNVNAQRVADLHALLAKHNSLLRRLHGPWKLVRQFFDHGYGMERRFKLLDGHGATLSTKVGRHIEIMQVADKSVGDHKIIFAFSIESQSTACHYTFIHIYPCSTRSLSR